MNKLSQAANDLGLGDGLALKQQLDDTEEERKKKMLALANPQMGGNLGMLSGSAAMSLGLGGARG